MFYTDSLHVILIIAIQTNNELIVYLNTILLMKICSNKIFNLFKSLIDGV